MALFSKVQWRFSSEKKSRPWVMINPRSRVQAWSTRENKLRSGSVAHREPDLAVLIEAVPAPVLALEVQRGGMPAIRGEAGESLIKAFLGNARMGRAGMTQALQLGNLTVASQCHQTVST